MNKPKNVLNKNAPNRFGFTLVELIVVITILAILATIAFISFSGYSKSARNSSRASDVKTIEKSLQVYGTRNNIYPLPESYTTVTYQGDDVYYQGTLGSSPYKELGNLSNIPVDALTKTEYIYSTTYNRMQYEILTIYEGEIVMTSPQHSPLKVEGVAANIINQAQAAEIYKPKINGTYNKIFVKTKRFYVPLPSIINSQVPGNGGGTFELDQNNIQLQVVTNGPNIPGIGTEVPESTGLLDINLSVYEGSITSSSPDSDKQALAQAIQGAYTGSQVLSTQPIYENILTQTNLDDLVVLVDNIVLGQGGNTSGGGDTDGGGDDGGSQTQSCEDIITQEQVDTLNAIWQNYDLDVSGDVDRDLRYDPDVYAPFTKTQWCNDAVLVDTYTASGITADLVNVYNAMNNLEQLWTREVDLSTQYSYLSQLDDLLLSMDETTYDSSVFNMTKLKGLSINGSFSTTGIALFTSIPQEIGNLVNLTYLDLYNVGLTSLSSEIGSLTNLEALYLSRNPISSLPLEIGNLINLKTLDFYYSDLTSLPTQIGNLTNLSFLNLYGNNLTSLPSEIGNLTNLTKLRLSSNGLTSLPNEIGNLTNLIQLRLGGNSLGNLTWSFGITTSDRTEGNITIGGNGTNIVITVLLGPVDGVCGTDDGKGILQLDSTKLCSSGSYSALLLNSNIYDNLWGPVTWTCNGLNGGIDAPCSAYYVKGSRPNANCSSLGQIINETINYPGCDSPDITMCTGDGIGLTLSACNIGSTVSGIGSSSYGNYYQWGNNYGSVEGGPTTTTLADATGYGPGNYFSSTSFIHDGGELYDYDWTTVQNNNLWGYTDFLNGGKTDYTLLQGPCATGYHVPTIGEWKGITLVGGWTNWIDMQSALKLPYAGMRSSNGASFGSVFGEEDGNYWSSTNDSTKAYVLRLSSLTVLDFNHYYTFSRGHGLSVRCFKN